MRARSPIEQHAEAAREITRRRRVRRAAIRTAGIVRGGRFLRIEQLGDVPRETALAFRPRVRDEVSLCGGALRCGPFELELDPFEREIAAAADGTRSVADLVSLARNRAPSLPPDPTEAALRLLVALHRYGAIEGGVVPADAT